MSTQEFQGKVEMNDDLLVKGNLNVEGRIIRKTPQTLFRYNYIDCGAPIMSHAQNSDTATADGHVHGMIFPGTNGEMYPVNICRIGATTAALETPILEGTVPATDTATTAAGLNIQMDQDTAADLGFELTIGGPLGDARAFTVGTHSGFIDISVFCAEWTTYDAVSIGFRKVENYDTGHAPIVAAGTGDALYTDFATFGLQESDKIQFATDLNNGGTGVYTDSTDTPTNSQNQRFRVSLAANGNVTYTMEQNGVANGGTLAAPTAVPGSQYTFDSGDVVIPYFFIHGKDHADSALLLKHLEVSRVAGSQYTD
jgi:hypothetical protein